MKQDTLKNDILEVLLEEGFTLDADNSENVFSHVDRFHCMEIVDRIAEAVGKVHTNTVVTCPKCNNSFLPPLSGV